MQTFNVDLKQELRVSFSDPELAEQYLVGDDAEFAQSFYSSDDLEDFVNSFILGFAKELNSVGWASSLDIEGFKTFHREKDTFTSTAKEYGSIIVRDVSRGLEVDYIY